MVTRNVLILIFVNQEIVSEVNTEIKKAYLGVEKVCRQTLSKVNELSGGVKWT